MPIPASNASKGVEKLTFSPLIRTSPPYPPVSLITSIPKRSFINVLLPGTIFTDKTQYLAGIQCKVNISQDLIAKKSFLILRISNKGVLLFIILCHLTQQGGRETPPHCSPYLFLLVSVLLDGEVFLWNLNLSRTHEMSWIAHDIGILIYQEHIV